MPKIIAVGHQKERGKDEFVKYIIDILRPQTRGLKLVRRGFADKLYDFCHSVYGWAGFQPRTYYQQHPARKKDLLMPLNKTVRDLLIEMGNYLRGYDKDIWINAALKTQDFDILFVTDLRYPNEFLHCQANHALTVRITRPGLPEPTDEADTALNGWEKKWDVQIENNKDLSHLHSLAEKFVREHILS